MKAITVWQPWASLIAIGAKPYEFRGHAPPKALRGKRIAIHAGARPIRRGEVEDLIERLAKPYLYPTPCLHTNIALPFLRRVLAGLPAPKRPPPPAPEPDFFAAPPGPPAPVAEPFSPPYRAIVCTAILGEPKRGDEVAREFRYGGNDSDRAGTFNWGWPMLEVQQLVPPPEAMGQQGFWDWNGSGNP